MRWRWIAIGTCCALAGPTLAQDRVLHEFIPDPRSDEGSVLIARQGGEPAAILYEGHVIEAPAGGAARPGERVLSADSETVQEGGSTRPRPPSFRPDRVTSLEESVGYFEVFSPSITPFKRVTALDTVVLAEDGKTPVLTTRSGATRRVVIEGADRIGDPGRDPFWASVVLDFSRGLIVPLPSVSPDARIYTLRTEPDVTLRIEKDRADNFYAVASRTPDAPIRLTFLTDAPETYFSTPIPAIPADTGAAEVPPVPPSVARRALQFASELGLRRGHGSLPHVLEALVAHFRGFEESREPPRNTGDIYLDLARGKKGVCRHRVYAFVITAQALGIPARFVQNEAHAWAEAKLGAVGWMRIDLGGAAVGLVPHNTGDAPPYEPALPDLLPRPAPYERTHARNGARPTQNGPSTIRSDPQTGASNAIPPRTNFTARSAQTSGAPLPIEVPSADQRPIAESAPSSSPTASEGPRVILSRYDHAVFRGRELHLGGAVVDADGQGLLRTRLTISLEHAISGQPVPLGITVTEENGNFRAIFGLPPDLPVGDYRIHIARDPTDPPTVHP